MFGLSSGLSIKRTALTPWWGRIMRTSFKTYLSLRTGRLFLHFLYFSGNKHFPSILGVIERVYLVGKIRFFSNYFLGGFSPLLPMNLYHQGVVEEMGTHEELMKLEGLYHSLVTRPGINILIGARDLHFWAPGPKSGLHSSKFVGPKTGSVMTKNA